MNRDIFQAITDRFIEQLKRGTVPWQKPWFAVQNVVSRKPYRGINALLLGSTDYRSPFWISFKQAIDLGGNVRKGEKSTPVISTRSSKSVTKPGK
jgi:antirestriction protein ArdC